MRKGFLIGGGLIIIGLLLQLCIGPVRWDVLAWPVNGIVLGCFLAVIILLFLLRKKVNACRFLGTYHAAIPTLVYAIVLTIIMGLTRQSADGEWLSNMLSFWPFVLIYVLMATILGLVILHRLTQIVNGPSLLLHLGLFLAMTTATLGNADMQRLMMITNVGETEWRALTQDSKVREMPFAINLKRFIMETYDDGTPKRFASEIQVMTRSGKNFQATVDVNKPVEVEGWKIYQYSYDMQMGAMSKTSVLELVRDPWLPAVYTGIFMMLLGAVLLVTYTRWSYKRLLPIGALVVVALCIVSYFMPIIRSTKLVPALQSPWFTPHILVYIICYSLMGVVAVMAIWMLIKGKQATDRSSLITSLDNLVYVGLAFMTVGMLFGALWAKEAWGHYWSWDPKETWAAITWFAYLVYVHYRQLPTHKPRLVLWILILSFILLQMCWWGINYLPSAQETSVHTYNT